MLKEKEKNFAIFHSFLKMKNTQDSPILSYYQHTENHEQIKR